MRTGNGWHLLFAAPAVEVEHSRLRPGVDIRSATELFVAPGSRHWSGTIYRIENPELPLAVWPFPAPAPRPSPPAPTGKVPSASTSRQAAYGTARLQGELARVYGATRGIDGNHSVYVAARRIACWEDACGLDLNQVAELLRTAGLAIRLEAGEIDRAIARGFGKGRQQPQSIPDRTGREAPPRGPREVTRSARDAIAAQIWPGRSGPARQNVVLAVLEIGVTAGTAEIDAGVRDVAERARLGRSTGARHLHWALRTGWLVEIDTWTVRPGVRLPDGSVTAGAVRVLDPTHARRFALGPKALAAGRAFVGHTTSRHYPRPPGCGDVFRHSFGGRLGLGPHKGRYHRLLAERPVTVPELAAVFAVSAGQVRRHLRALQHEGLAGRVAGELWTAGARDPEEVAAELGVVGATARQRLRHRRDTNDFAAWLAARAREAKAARDRQVRRLGPCQRSRPTVPRRRRSTLLCPRRVGAARPLRVEPAHEDLAEAAAQEARELRAWERAFAA